MSSTITATLKKFEIKDRQGNVLHAVEGAETILQAVEKLAKEARERDEYADLRYADLEPIRQDVLAVLIAAPHEVVGLRQAFAEGRINGSIYEDGECVCLVGTAERLQSQRLEGSPFNKPIPGLVRASSRPAERFVYGLQPGDTPENSQFSALMVKWIDEFLAAARAVAETLPPVDELKEN